MRVHTATFNQAIDSRGRSSMNMTTVPVRITEAGVRTEGRAQAGSGVPVTYARTSDETPLASRKDASTCRRRSPSGSENQEDPSRASSHD